MAPREIAQLRLPIAVVGGELVQEDERRAIADLFKIEANAVFRSRLGHLQFLPCHVPDDDESREARQWVSCRPCFCRRINPESPSRRQLFAIDGHGLVTAQHFTDLAGGLQRGRAEDQGVPSQGTGGSNRRNEYGCVYPSPVASHRCAHHVLGRRRRHRNTGFGPSASWLGASRPPQPRRPSLHEISSPPSFARPAVALGAWRRPDAGEQCCRCAGQRHDAGYGS